MSGVSQLDKHSAASTVRPPRMLGETDVSVIMQFAAQLPPDAQILEVGPFLGGLTVELAKYGQVTVVDRFVWTSANEDNYPGLLQADESFHNLFRANMERAGLAIASIEATLPDLTWSGGKLDLVVIDAPRNAEQLHGCLKAICGALKPGAHVLIKHALNERDFGMGALVDALIGASMFDMVPVDQPAWCNIATIKATDQAGRLAEYDDVDELIANAPMSDQPTDPWYGHRLSLFRLAQLALSRQWPEAFARLTELPASIETLHTWDDLEPLLLGHAEVDDERLATLSEIIWLRSDIRQNRKLPLPLGATAPERLRAFWRNNAGHTEVLSGLDPWLLTDPRANVIAAALEMQKASLFGKSVFEIGPDLAGGAITAILSGAKQYLGITTSDIDPAQATNFEQFPQVKLAHVDDVAVETVAAADVVIIHPASEDTSESEVALREALKQQGRGKTIVQLLT
ncbi:class I SAM-dependent methyltransferase [Yoonia litorea]|uniref:Methyltransferase domain-containing protein n=1 Tax=Yoonia litorea TaxID=1123755 RepID=A0A1I6N2P8_9RHOB|nr:class I SAM-dependent methyltransferase [Yoonia litorea]SFS22252.1 hypothetical protein SAMN05444714_3222 [Yoonia litorea]